MFRRKRPINERLAEAVIDSLKRTGTPEMRNAKTINPESITSWCCTVDADGRVDVQITLDPRNPNLISSYTAEFGITDNGDGSATLRR